jgi:hypothetical protein
MRRERQGCSGEPREITEPQPLPADWFFSPESKTDSLHYSLNCGERKTDLTSILLQNMPS